MMPRLGRSLVRQSLRDLRDLQPVNWALSSLARPLAGGRPPEWLVKHLPRHGIVSVSLPTGDKVRFWSLGDDYITSRLWWMGIAGYESETALLFMRFVENASVVLDVGAYTGYYSILAAATNRTARVFAFEPHPRIAARLGRNLDLNEHLAVTVLPFAVGRSRGVATFHVGGPGLPTSSSLASDWRGMFRSIPVVVTDLDSFASEWDLERVDVVKIDVESCEEDVIDGMTAILSCSRPILFIEVLSHLEHDVVSSRLRDMDYLFYYLTFDGPMPETSLVSTAPLIDHAHTPFNHLACPAEKVPLWLAAKTE